MMQTSGKNNDFQQKPNATVLHWCFPSVQRSRMELKHLEKLYSNASFQKSLTRLLLTIHTPCWLQLTGGTTFFHNRAAMHLPENESFGCQQMERKHRTHRLATWFWIIVPHWCALMPPQVTLLTLGSDGHQLCVLSERNEWGQLKCLRDAFNTNCVQQHVAS